MFVGLLMLTSCNKSLKYCEVDNVNDKSLQYCNIVPSLYFLSLSTSSALLPFVSNCLLFSSFLSWATVSLHLSSSFMVTLQRDINLVSGPKFSHSVLFWQPGHDIPMIFHWNLVASNLSVPRLGMMIYQVSAPWQCTKDTVFLYNFNRGDMVEYRSSTLPLYGLPGFPKTRHELKGFSAGLRAMCVTHTAGTAVSLILGNDLCTNAMQWYQWSQWEWIGKDCYGG